MNREHSDILIKETEPRQRDNCTIRIATTIDQVEALRSAWQSWQWHPNADLDYYLTVIAGRENIERPHVMLLRREEEPEAILVGRIEKVRLTCQIGYKSIRLPELRALTIVYGGILGNMSNENCEHLFAELNANLARREAEVVVFSQLPLTSPLFQIVAERPSFIQRDHAAVPNLHWRLNLPDSVEGFHHGLSKSTRNNLRYYANRLTKKYGEALAIRCYRHPEEIDELMSAVESIATKTYHRGLGVGFRNDEETRRRILLGLKRQRFRSYVASIDEKPCAFWNGTLYGDTIFTGDTGFDPTLQSDRIGMHVLTRVIEEMCKEGRRAVDFGFGDAEYKRSLSNESWQEATIYMFAPSFRPAIINMIRSRVLAGNNALKRMTARLGVLNRVKKTWRNKLAGNSNADGRPPSVNGQFPTDEKATNGRITKQFD